MADSFNVVNELIKAGITLVAAGAGAWLSVRFFPIRAKRDEWFWQKQVEAESFLLESLSEISFHTVQYLNGHYADTFNMSDKSSAEAYDYVVRKLKEIHRRAPVLKVYLNKKQGALLDSFLEESQRVCDVASETWGQWEHNDQYAPEDHKNKMIDEIQARAAECLSQLRFKYLKHQK